MGKKADEAVLGARVGHSGLKIDSKDVSNTVLEGLILSNILYKPLSFFKPNPCNAVFDALKTDEQFLTLYKDISETKAILNPLIVMPDGLIIEGHSRYEVAKKLSAEGNSIGMLPTRIITTPLTNEEIKQRVYLGNLLRFEIDEDTRIVLYAEIWPDYFCSTGKPGRKRDHGDTISVSDLSKKLGKSIPQIKRDAAIYRNAKKKQGNNLTVQDISLSRKELNTKRKRKEKLKKEQRQQTHSINTLPVLDDFQINILKRKGTWNFDIDINYIISYMEKLKLAGFITQSTILDFLIAWIMHLKNELFLHDSKDKDEI